MPVFRGFQLSDLLSRSVNKAFDKVGGGSVDALDNELRVVEVGQGLFEVAQAGGDLGMHGGDVRYYNRKGYYYPLVA